ncbi:hypothetical protein ES705_28458 [subsurface metagenome]
MNKKTSEENNILTIGELAEVSGTRLTTLKYYTELGILPFIVDHLVLFIYRKKINPEI